MAKKSKGSEVKSVIKKIKKRTSIGKSKRSKPKHKKASKKGYRGQGK